MWPMSTTVLATSELVNFDIATFFSGIFFFVKYGHDDLIHFGHSQPRHQIDVSVERMDVKTPAWRGGHS